MRYWRIDITDFERNEIVTVCTTTNKEEADRQYDVWLETTPYVSMFEMNI